MAARLGIVLYWIGNIIAVLCLLVLAGLTALAATGGSPDWVGAVILVAFYLLPLAAISYGIGRACRYVLAGF